MLSLGIGLGLTMVRSGGGDPAEWGGLVPLIDWDPANAVLSGSDITSIPNVGSETGSDLTGVAANYPTIVAASAHFNSQPAAAFSGTQRFTFGDLGAASGGPITIVAVAKVLVVSAGANYLLSAVSDRFAVHGDTTPRWRLWLSHDTATIGNDEDPTDASIVVGTLTGGTQRIYVNSTTQDASGASNACDFSGTGVVGNYVVPNAVFTFGGQLARILVFDSTSWLASGGLAALGTKYGVTIV
jgi:hypothetical protein